MQKCFESVEQLSQCYNVLKHRIFFLHRIFRQGTDPVDVKKVLVKMINCHHALQFEKYNNNNRDLIQQLLT